MLHEFFLSLDEYLEQIYYPDINESGIRGMKELAQTYKKAEIYFHIDLDGVTSAVGMKAYLEGYGIKVVDVHTIQYGGMEFEAVKPKKGNLAVMVDFAHGKPMMHIHTDHHDSQTGTVASTSTNFKHAASNAGTISQEISPKDIYPTEDIKLINMVDSADYVSKDISVDDVLRAAYNFDKKLSIEKNRTFMGLVANKMLLAFKNKKGFLKEVVMNCKPSLISMFTVIRKVATDAGYPIDELTAKGEDYRERQAGKLQKLKKIEEVFKLGNGEYAMFGNSLVQYGGGYMAKGGFDRYTPFKLNPGCDFFIIGWPMGLVQASKNPFKKGKNPYHLGDIAKKILTKYKSKLSKIVLPFGQLKRSMERDIWKKGSPDSFGFTYEDLEALFGDAVKSSKWAKQNKAIVSSIAGKHFDKLSDKQLDILDNFEINIYDLITRQSGGHKDITNIAGLNLIPGKGEGVKWVKTIMTDLAKEMKDMKLK